jgi:hypothetical protein
MPFGDLGIFVATSQMPFVGICCHNILPTKKIKSHNKICRDIPTRLPFITCTLYECMYVCMYLCMYVRMYLCIYVFMYLCTYVLMYLCIHLFNSKGQRVVGP